MKEVKMKYGEQKINVCIKEENLLGIIEANKVKMDKDEDQIIMDALLNPISSARLKKLVHKGEKVCIVIPDVTRAWQKTSKFLYRIVEELNSGGVEDKDIIFISALGSHRKQSKEEHEQLLGKELSSRFEVIDHECQDKESLLYLGETSYGTPVYVNKIAMSCDHIVLTGGIIYHLLVGWSGGKKTILPGIAGVETIMKNHSLCMNDTLGEGVNANVRCGNIENNPVHLDMLEAASFVRPTFIFNVVMGTDGNIAGAVAGNYIDAHTKGREIVESLDGVFIDKKAQLAIASSGGYPKDINLYQSIKTLINAKEAVCEGGYIIALAKCSEGIGGDKNLQDIILNYNNLLDREKALREDFTIAKFVAYYFCEIAYKYNVILVSDIDPKLAQKANMRAVKTLEEALKIVQEEIGENVLTYLMPHAANTLPKLR